MKNYSILCIIDAIAISAVFAACSKNSRLSMGNLSSSDNEPRLVPPYHYVHSVSRESYQTGDSPEGYVGSLASGYSLSKDDLYAGKSQYSKFLTDLLLRAFPCLFLKK